MENVILGTTNVSTVVAAKRENNWLTTFCLSVWIRSRRRRTAASKLEKNGTKNFKYERMKLLHNGAMEKSDLFHRTNW